MARRTFKVELEWDEEGGGYVVRVPELPGCFTQGETAEDALENAREAIAGHVAALRQQRKMPPPVEKTRRTVEVSI
jgi:predicted RNase H-like HicB family nuclease